MDPQWIEALKEVLQGELKRELAPVHEKLDRMDSRLENVENRLENVENRLENVETRMENMEGRMENMEGRMENMEGRLENMENQMDTMQTQLDRIECTQNEDVIAVLRQMNQKTTDRFERSDSQMRVLNDRLFTVEADVRKLQQS